MKKVKSNQKITRRKATFSLESADAKEIILLGDFNSWDPKLHPMKMVGNGVWNVSLNLLPGKYEYKFLVDGEWKTDPKNEQTCINCFGTHNSILNLPPSK